jgi:hypothetical protein
MARCLAGVFVSAAAVFVTVLFPANANARTKTTRIPHRHAAAGRTSDHHDGNGRHNHSTFSNRSPTHNRGYQHTNNSNAGGLNNVQNALCRRSAVCHVTQQVVIVRPGNPNPSAPEEAGTVTSQNISPGPAAEPAPQEAGAPAAPQEAPAAPAPPLLYLGPYGIMLMTPTASMPLIFGTSMARGISFPFPTNMFS